jgi:hypothetical protein
MEMATGPCPRPQRVRLALQPHTLGLYGGAIAGNGDRARSPSVKTTRPRSVFTRAALDSSIATSGGEG